MINGCYNGLAGVTLTSEQSKQYNNAYGIAYTYNLPAPRMEDFVTGNGEAIVDRYAELAYQKDPNKTGVSWCDFAKQRIAAIKAAQAAQTAASAATITTAPKITGSIAPVVKASTQAATSAATPVTTAPATTTTEKKNNTIWWIVLGGAVAFGVYKLLSGGKKKRR